MLNTDRGQFIGLASTVGGSKKEVTKKEFKGAFIGGSTILKSTLPLEVLAKTLTVGSINNIIWATNRHKTYRIDSRIMIYLHLSP